jgi:hypothetical protein
VSIPLSWNYFLINLISPETRNIDPPQPFNPSRQNCLLQAHCLLQEALTIQLSCVNSTFLKSLFDKLNFPRNKKYWSTTTFYPWDEI